MTAMVQLRRRKMSRSLPVDHCDSRRHELRSHEGICTETNNADRRGKEVSLTAGNNRESRYGKLQ